MRWGLVTILFFCHEGHKTESSLPRAPEGLVAGLWALRPGSPTPALTCATCLRCQLRRMRNDCRDLPRDDSVIFSTADDVFYACSNHSLRTAYSLFIKNTSQILVLSSSCLGDGSFYPHVTQEMENARSPTALDCQSTLPPNTLCKWNTVTRNWPPSILDSGCHTCVSGF